MPKEQGFGDLDVGQTSQFLEPEASLRTLFSPSWSRHRLAPEAVSRLALGILTRMAKLGELMEREIGEQPAALADLAESYLSELQSAFQGQDFEAILLAARGSSDHAALYGRYLIEINLGIPGMLVAPSVLTRYGVHVRYPKCLVVGISQSGAAPDVDRVLAAAKGDGHKTLVITNTPNSLMAQTAETTLLLGVGEERSVAATKSYSASLLALYQLTRALGARLPAPHLPGDDWLQMCRKSAKEAVPRLGYPCFTLGRGYGFATALESALKLMECAMISSKGFSTADFQHGPKALAGPGSCAIVYGEKPAGLAEQGCDLILCPKPPCEEPLRPIWEVMFAQCLALEAAKRKGLNPDVPPFLNKITNTY